MTTVIKAENISKQYRLGYVGSGSIKDDVKRWWYGIRGKDDPLLKIGDSNDRTQKGESDYVWALKDINFEIQQGDTVGIIGRNGAGKSTLLKLLSKVTAPTTGNIKVKGRIASLLEVGTGFHGELTGRENIYLNGAIMGMRKHEITRRLDEIVDFAGVERYLDTPVKRYSSGMYVRLGFAVAAHLENEILIVDEVLAVGDAEFQKKCLGKMGDVAKGEGRTVLFVSHNMASVSSLCNTAICLKNGHFDYYGTTENTINRYLINSSNLSCERDLEKIDFRSGNQKVIFSAFSVENKNGEIIDSVLTGSTIKLKFRLKINDIDVRKIDLGFSLHNNYDDMLTYLYSSFQKIDIRPEKSKYVTVNCIIEDFPFSEKQIVVRGRILTDGNESDWPKENIGLLNVENGDFYNTGVVTDNIAPFLIKGKWEKI
jgi:lipopolysaccharide transport system ATP-binding protein